MKRLLLQLAPGEICQQMCLILIYATAQTANCQLQAANCELQLHIRCSISNNWTREALINQFLVASCQLPVVRCRFSVTACQRWRAQNAKLKTQNAKRVCHLITGINCPSQATTQSRATEQLPLPSSTFRIAMRQTVSLPFIADAYSRSTLG